MYKEAEDNVGLHLSMFSDYCGFIDFSEINPFLQKQ